MKPPAHLHLDTHYRGWKIIVVRGQPCRGTATREHPPHATYAATGPDFAQVLKELRDGIDAFEARPNGSATSPG